MRVLVVGLGNAERGDDGAARELIDLLHRRGVSGCALETAREPLELIELWQGFDIVLIADALHDSGDGVSVESFEGPSVARLGRSRPVSSHRFGLESVIALARALDLAPRRLVVLGIPATRFGHGPGLSATARAGVERAADLVIEQLGGADGDHSPRRGRRAASRGSPRKRAWNGSDRRDTRRTSEDA